MVKNKCYIGAVVLSKKGKVYGGTTRQVCGKDRNDAKKKLRKKFKHENNKVKITKFTLKKNWK